MGNRFEVVQGARGEDDRIRYVAPHHKTERRQGGRVLTYMVPEGPLTHLMLIHIKEGHAVLCDNMGREQPLLFMTRAGNGFDDVTFPQWWASFFDSPWGPPSDVTYFPPNKGRTIFVEHYMSTTGNHPEEWEGAAYAMGNSIKQWREHYAPQMRDRLAQEAVNSHQQWRATGRDQGGRGEPASAPSMAPSFNSPNTTGPSQAPNYFKRANPEGMQAKRDQEGPSRTKPKVENNTCGGLGGGTRRPSTGGAGGTCIAGTSSTDDSDVEIVEKEVEVIVISDDFE
jgi:hypothetical protein